jgi:putative addiction module component (TIGR02574 family)
VSVSEEMISAVFSLSESDRAFLAHELITSLEAGTDDDSEAAWNDEIDRRIKEIDQGHISCQPLDESLRAIRQRLNAHSKSS